MVRRIRPSGCRFAASWAAMATIAAGACIALAACGSTLAASHSASVGGPLVTRVPGGKASVGVALCMDLPKLTSVRVSRAMAVHELQPGLALPRGITFRESRPVRGLATALCGLPKMPRGPVSCPAQFAGSLRLVFAAGGRPFPPVTVQISGCRVVTGLGPARTAPSAFWRTLDKDLGVKFPLSAGQSGGINP
jgi:hypothetical protein